MLIIFIIISFLAVIVHIEKPWGLKGGGDEF